MHATLTFVRITVLVIFGIAGLAAVASWLVRTRRVSPFGTLGKILRQASDPVLRPVEPAVVRLGGNPVNAGWWLVVFAALGGIVALTTIEWLITAVWSTLSAVDSGPLAAAVLAVRGVYTLLVFALLLRVVAQWFGRGRYTRWLRPAYTLTDWIVEPIRRILPPLGAFDISPIVAWFALWLLKAFVLKVLL